ncbi:response regulator [Candidatus Omnitrophota bacterium]
MGRNKKVNILIVDDEPDFAESMCFWFKAKEYVVNVIHNGEEALRVIRKTPPDIVFLDIIMPNMDGYTVLKLVREFNRTLPVVMMSAYEKEKNVQKKTNFYGVFNFYDKGESLEKALTLLKSALNLEEKSNHKNK